MEYVEGSEYFDTVAEIIADFSQVIHIVLTVSVDLKVMYLNWRLCQSTHNTEGLGIGGGQDA